MLEKIRRKYKYVVMFLLGGIILGSIGVYAATILSSSEVSYDNSKSGGNSNNVQGAIEELYEKSNRCTTESCSLTESKFYVGYTYNQTAGSSNYCVTGDEATCVRTDCYTSSAKTCPAGTIIDYIVSGTNTRVRFHVMYDNGRTLTMQSQKNTINHTPWYSASQNNTKGPLTVLTQLENATASWTNVEEQTYTMGTTVFKDNAFTGCSSYDSCTANTYTLSSRKAKARMITVQEASNLGCKFSTTGSCPIWMYNYLYQATSNGGTVADTTANSAGVYNLGYWTMSSYIGDVKFAWFIARNGSLDHGGTHYTSANMEGARAVIEVSK